MTVLGLLVMTILLLMDSVKADGKHGSGYVGCFRGGLRWQNALDDDFNVTSVDDCVSQCSKKNKPFAAVSIRSCFCSDSLPSNVQKENESNCNFNCICNTRQVCGSGTHYSVFNTMGRITSPGFNATLKCLAFCRLNESTHIPSALDITTKPGRNMTCKNDSNANEECARELVNKCCSCRQLWLRIVIDVAVMFGILFLIILMLMVVRFCRNRQRGMFDDWQPRSSGQARQVESGSSRSGDDLLHRNHSYRNLSGSSTLDRGLQSVEQASAPMAASGVPAMVRTLSDDSGNRYGSLPAPAKGASARSSRAVNINLVKPSTGTGPAQMPNKGNSNEGEYHEPDSVRASDQPGNPPAPPDSKSKPKHNSKTCQKEHAEDTAKVVENVLDKSKRRSLFNIMSKGSRMPSSPRPSKDEDDFPTDPEHIMDRHRDCRYGKKNRKKSETTERRRSFSFSKDEEVFEDPKSYTLPNDIYALPNKPACRNRQQNKMSDTTKGAKSGDVEPQEGYSRLSRLFKPRAFGKGKSKRGGDTTSPEEYSVLHPDSKDTDYGKLGGHGDPDVPVIVDKAESDCKPFEGMYALEDDNGYAVVGEGMTTASQSGDYEMIAHGQMK